MKAQLSSTDSRYFQIFGQSLFLVTGIFFLGWGNQLSSFFIAILACFIFQSIAIYMGLAPHHSLRSSLITSLGLCLLLRVNSPWLMVVAAALAIGQKFVIRYKGYHFWNPANFAIGVLVLLTHDAWISPAQWGHFSLVFVAILIVGTYILQDIKRWDTAFFYGVSLLVLCWLRYVYYLGWNWEVWWHQFNTGSFWLYAMFMITDPMTSPQHKWLRRIWAVTLAGATFYVQHFKFIPTAAVWTLFVWTPLVPFLNAWTRSSKWNWIQKK